MEDQTAYKGLSTYGGWRGGVACGLGKQGKRRLPNEIFKKNPNLRSDLLLGIFSSSGL